MKPKRKTWKPPTRKRCEEYERRTIAQEIALDRLKRARVARLEAAMRDLAKALVEMAVVTNGLVPPVAE